MAGVHEGSELGRKAERAENKEGVGLDKSLSGMTWQDVDVGVARRLWRQRSWAEDEDARSGAGPGCLSMVQSYGQN